MHEADSSLIMIEIVLASNDKEFFFLSCFEAGGSIS